MDPILEQIKDRDRQITLGMMAILAFSRLVTLLALPYEGFLGYGDLLTYFHVAQIPGWPYLQSWAEYPPIFPFLSEIVYRLSNGSEHVYVYLVAFLLLLADMGSLFIFRRVARRILGEAGDSSAPLFFW